MKAILFSSMLFWSALINAATPANSPSTPLATIASDVKTGYFIDAPVTGLYYQTSSNLSGFTDKGAFQYRAGDVVDFYLGNSAQGYRLSSMSAQEVLTPSHATTKPSRAINMTRLLLSLNTQPERDHEIVLDANALSSASWQKRLRGLDLNLLDSIKKVFEFDLVSAETAVQHLNQSQRYIENHFISDEVVFGPRERMLLTQVVKTRDHIGRACFVDMRHIKHPKFQPPIGEVRFMITSKSLTEYPSLGDRFSGCYFMPRDEEQAPITQPLSNFHHIPGLIGCASKGCTRNDLNGFSLEERDDEGDWKYRSMAMSFDPVTELWMEKIQGLGPHPMIRHPNRSEMLWFTLPEGKSIAVQHQGVWQETAYVHNQIHQRCLLIEDNQVWRSHHQDATCPTQRRDYAENVTADYGDMWWLTIKHHELGTNLPSLNVMVRWYPKGRSPQHTTWEYLPAGENWDQGILYRYQQQVVRQQDGSDEVTTHAIGEFKKIGDLPL